MRHSFCSTRVLLAVLGIAFSSLGAAPALAQEKAASKQDFIPGEKLIFLDDFSDMEDGSPPPHWKARGGAVSLRSKGDAHQLLVTKSDTRLQANLKNLPKNFTVEAELAVGPGTQSTTLVYLLLENPSETKLKVTLQLRGDKRGSAFLSLQTTKEEIGNAEVPADLEKPLALSLWLQEGRLRAYLNGERLVDANQIDLGKIESLSLAFQPTGGPIAISSVRVAESAPDFGRTILSTGRYVTHGIRFDIDSDRLRPESTPVLKMVASALVADAGLKVRIEGHTDSTGDPAHNMDLSRRRADAVRSALVGRFGIQPDRLTTSGLGATKPLGPNDTSDGRANNRRVEFVRQ